MTRRTRYKLISALLRTTGVAASAGAAFLIEMWVDAAVQRCRHKAAASMEQEG